MIDVMSKVHVHDDANLLTSAVNQTVVRDTLHVEQIEGSEGVWCA